MSIAGEGMFRIYRYFEGQFKQHQSQRAEGRTYTSHCWLKNDIIVCGTDNARIHVFEDGELKVDLEVLDSQQREKLTNDRLVKFILNYWYFS